MGINANALIGHQLSAAELRGLGSTQGWEFGIELTCQLFGAKDWAIARAPNGLQLYLMPRVVLVAGGPRQRSIITKLAERESWRSAVLSVAFLLNSRPSIVWGVIPEGVMEGGCGGATLEVLVALMQSTVGAPVEVLPNELLSGWQDMWQVERDLSREEV